MTSPGHDDAPQPQKRLRTATDVELDALREKFPAWRIWYVYSAVGSGTWCAQPKPLLNCGTPAQLRTSMRLADQRRLATLTHHAGDTPPGEDPPPGEDEAPPGGAA